MTLTVIIPVFNEQGLIAELLSKVTHSDTSPFSKEIIVVDDGSTDGTSTILGDLSKVNKNIKIIHLPKNSGKASAIKAGLKVAYGDVILIQDADLEYSPEEYRNLLEPFNDNNAKVVYGSRFLRRFWPEKMKILNWLANKFFTMLINLLYDTRITDEGTGYKLFRKDVIQSIDIKYSGFEFCSEVTAKLLKKGVQIIEVPVSYKARNKKEGKKPGFIDGVKVLRTIIKYRFVK